MDEPRLHRVFRLGLSVADSLRAVHPGFDNLPSTRRTNLVHAAVAAACGTAWRRDRAWVFCAALDALTIQMQMAHDAERIRHQRAQRRGPEAAPAPTEPGPPTLPFG